eukprot:scaffold24572_cov65-Phaeocystis_antarctica.AAC.9
MSGRAGRELYKAVIPYPVNYPAPARRAREQAEREPQIERDKARPLYYPRRASARPGTRAQQRNSTNRALRCSLCALSLEMIYTHRTRSVEHLARAAEVEAHVASGGAEGDAVRERHPMRQQVLRRGDPAGYHPLGQRVGHIEPHEVGCLGARGAHAGQRGEHGERVVAVGAQVREQPQPPCCALGLRVGSEGGRVSEGRHLVRVGVREGGCVSEGRHLGGVSSDCAEAGEERRVRHDGQRDIERGHVVRLRRRGEHDQPLPQPSHRLRPHPRPRLRRRLRPRLQRRLAGLWREEGEARGEGGVVAQRHLAPHLVAQQRHLVLDAEARQAQQVIAAPAAARGVVRVAPEQDLGGGRGERRLQRPPLDAVAQGALSETRLRQCYPHQCGAAVGRSVEEGRVDGRRDRHGVARSRRAAGTHRVVEARQQARQPAEPCGLGTAAFIVRLEVR